MIFLCFFVCFIFAHHHSIGQSKIIFHKTIGITEGLQERTILKLDRDTQGYFWLFLTNSIQRYNGRVLDSEVSHNITEIKYFKCLSNDHIIIINHANEAFLFDKLDNSLLPLEFEKKIPNNEKLIDINLIEEKIFIYTQRNGIVKVYESEDHYESLTEIDQINNIPVVINYIFKLENKYLIHAEGDLLYEYSENSWRNIPLFDHFDQVKRRPIHNYINPEKLYFSFAQRLGTFLYQDSLETINISTQLSFAKSDKNGKEIIGLSRAFRYTDEILYREGDSTISWSELTNTNDKTTDVYVEDLEDEILFSSHVGLLYFKFQTPGLDQYFVNQEILDDFGNVVTSISNINEDIFFTKENGGLFRLNNDKTITEINSDPYIENITRACIKKDQKTLILSGYTETINGCLFEYNYENGQIVSHKFIHPVRHVYEHDDGYYIAQGLEQRSVLIDYDPKEKKIRDTILDLSNELILRITPVNEKDWLINTSNRLILFNFLTRRSKDVLENTYIQSLEKLNGHWLVGTNGKGLLVLDQNFNIRKELNISNGLSSNQIYSISSDNSGNIWLGTGFGMNVLDEKFYLIGQFLKNDGIWNPEFNTHAYTKSKNGNLILGTINGITEIHPSKALASLASDKINFDHITYTLNGTRLTEKTIEHYHKINAASTDIEIFLDKADFYSDNLKSTLIPYRPLLIPDSMEMDMVQNVIKIDRFKKGNKDVLLIPNRSIGNNDDLHLHLNVKQKYSNLILISGLLVLFGFISYLVSKSIIDRNRRRENEKRQNEVLMAELELQALRSQMNPHFIFNSLGAILLYLQTNEKKKAEKFLTKFAKLMRMFLESSKSKFISISEEKSLLELYLQLEKLRFEDKFEYKIDVDERVDQHNLVIPSMLLQPFIENAINHGLYHKRMAKGKLDIGITPQGSEILITIEDNGIGRKRAQQIKENSVKKHKSRATQIIQERLDVLKEAQNVNVNIQYHDLEDTNGNALGTKVEITTPKLFKSEYA